MNIQKNRICRFAAVISVVMMTLLWAGSANADLIGFSPDGSGGAPYSDVTGFDWAPGNTLAQGAQDNSHVFGRRADDADPAVGWQYLDVA